MFQNITGSTAAVGVYKKTETLDFPKFLQRTNKFDPV